MAPTPEEVEDAELQAVIDAMDMPSSPLGTTVPRLWEQAGEFVGEFPGRVARGAGIAGEAVGEFAEEQYGEFTEDPGGYYTKKIWPRGRMVESAKRMEEGESFSEATGAQGILAASSVADPTLASDVGSATLYLLEGDTESAKNALMWAAGGLGAGALAAKLFRMRKIAKAKAIANGASPAEAERVADELVDIASKRWKADSPDVSGGYYVQPGDIRVGGQPPAIGRKLEGPVTRRGLSEESWKLEGPVTRHGLSEERQAQILSDWVDAPPGTPPPAGLDPRVVASFERIREAQRGGASLLDATIEEVGRPYRPLPRAGRKPDLDPEYEFGRESWRDHFATEDEWLDHLGVEQRLQRGGSEDIYEQATRVEPGPGQRRMDVDYEPPELGPSRTPGGDWPPGMEYEQFVGGAPTRAESLEEARKLMRAKHTGPRPEADKARLREINRMLKAPRADVLRGQSGGRAFDAAHAWVRKAPIADVRRFVDNLDEVSGMQDSAARARVLIRELEATNPRAAEEALRNLATEFEGDSPIFDIIPALERDLGRPRGYANSREVAEAAKRFKKK